MKMGPADAEETTATHEQNMKNQILIQFDGEQCKSAEREMVRTHVLKTHLHLRLLRANAIVCLTSSCRRSYGVAHSGAVP